MTATPAPGTVTRRRYSARPTVLFLAFLRRDWAIAWSYRLPFFIGLGQSLIGVVFLYFLARLVGPRLSTVSGGLRVGYFAYVVLGTVLLSLFSVSLTAFAQRLRTDQTTGTLEVLFTMPPRPSLTVVASAAYQISYALVTAVVTVCVAVAFGFRFHTSSGGVVIALAGIAATLALFCAVGIAFAAFVVLFKRGETIVALASGALSLLGGVYFPVALMPAALRGVANALPFTWALNVLRETLLAHQLPYARLLELVGSAVVLVPLALWAFTAALQRARRQGTLGQY